MKIIIDGKLVEVSGGATFDGLPLKPITQEEYDALPEEQKNSETAWLVTDAGSGGGSAGGMTIPRGVIWEYYPPEDGSIPDGWAICDGTNGTPDLRDRFILGAGTKYTVGETGGEEEVTLTVDQMPRHNHPIPLHGGDAAGTQYTFNTTKTNDSSTVFNTISSNNTGFSQPHPNMPPYYVLVRIMKL